MERETKLLARGTQQVERSHSPESEVMLKTGLFGNQSVRKEFRFQKSFTSHIYGERPDASHRQH